MLTTWKWGIANNVPKGEGEDAMEEHPHLDNIPEARPRIMPVARGEGGDVL